MKVPFYGHERQYQSIKNEIDAKMQEVILSGQYAQGPMLKKFEEELAAYASAKYAIGVGNGTAALLLTFMALGLGEGDELITNANTFFATAEAMWIAGCTAVLVDCDPKTKCIDPEAIKKAITERTKAIVPVHLYGQCAPMRDIRKIGDEHGLFVVEDNAQAIDAHGDNFKIGELSDAVCTSFIIQKNLGTFGDGGAIWTNHQYINDKVRKLRNHGSNKRDMHSFGFNSRLDDLHAGVLSAKLKHIKEWSDRRIEIADKYTEGLTGCDFLDLPYACLGYRHVFHLYVIETKEPADRDKMLDYLIKNGVMSGPGSMDYDHDMPSYIQDIVDWLDDPAKVHPCNGETTFKGFQVMMAACRSAVQRGKVMLPLGPGEPELEALKKALS